MEPAKGTELDKLQSLLAQAGLGKDLNLLSAILFVRNLVGHLGIYTQADKSRIQQFVLQEIGKRQLDEKTFDTLVEAIETFLLRSTRYSELEEQINLERRSTETLLLEMEAFFGGLRTSRDKQEHSLKLFNRNTEKAVKTAPSRLDLVQQMRGLLAGFVSEFREEARQWEARAKALERTARYDGLLTQLYNRRSFDAYLAEALVTSQSRDLPLSMCMIDVDHFKSVNDTYGHLVGDDVLRALAKIVKSTADQHDGYAARYGGEELVLCLAMPLDKASAVAEELRRDVEEYDFLSRKGGKLMEQVIHFTVSIGVAELREGWDVSRLVGAADQAMYMAKESGRNLVGRFSERGSKRIGWT